MFEKASRMKLRFGYKGLVSVEDLWDLPVTELDTIFKRLNAANREHKEESLLDTKSGADEILDLQIAVVRHVVQVKLQERRDRENEADRAAKKQKLLNVIARKQDAELEGRSVEDLIKEVEAL